MLSQKDPFAVSFQSPKNNPHEQKQETKTTTQEQNTILTQLKTKGTRAVSKIAPIPSFTIPYISPLIYS